MTERLVATDCETTGLNPNDGHLLLEIAVYITEATAPFWWVEPDGFHAVIRHNRDEAYALADDYVREMHTKTGLWDKLEDGTPVEQVDEQLLAYLKKHLDKREGRVFGNSIRLDMNFIDAYLPKSADWLHYRFLDASGLAWFANLNYGIPHFEKRKSHSAKDDIEESLNELDYIADSLIRKPTKDRVREIIRDAFVSFPDSLNEEGADFIADCLLSRLTNPETELVEAIRSSAGKYPEDMHFTHSGHAEPLNATEALNDEIDVYGHLSAFGMTLKYFVARVRRLYPDIVGREATDADILAVLHEGEDARGYSNPCPVVVRVGGSTHDAQWLYENTTDRSMTFDEWLGASTKSDDIEDDDESTFEVILDVRGKKA